MVDARLLCTFYANPPCHCHQREKLGYTVGSVAAATKNIQRGDAQLSSVRHPVWCYQLLAQLEEREACSWLRCTSAGEKTLWEGKRKAIDVSQGVRLKNRVRTDCLVLSVYRNSK